MAETDADPRGSAAHQAGTPNFVSLNLRPEIFRISDRFSQEQAETAYRIWPSILRLLQPLLLDANRVVCCDTPNGIVAESSAGWTLTMCALGEAALPHFIAVRCNRSTCTSTLRAYQNDTGFEIVSAGKPNDTLQKIMLTVIHKLGGREYYREDILCLAQAPQQALSKQ